MKVQVLGSAAGGGFPQWNCNCRNCAGVRAGTINAKTRTQSSITVSVDGENWILFNTSPDIREQLASFGPMQPNRAIRDTGIAAIVYMDSQIDHTTGLLMLREGCPHNIWCTEMVEQDLTSGFPTLNMLKHWNGGNHVNRIPINEGDEANEFTIPQVPELKLTAVPLLSSAPPYSPHRDDPHPGDNIGMQIEDTRTGKKLFYAPGLGQIEPHLRAYMESADVLLVDGTIWQEDELIVTGVGDKLGVAMGHLPQSGKGGMIEYLDTLEKPRKVLIHINNTNPILDEDSAEHAEVLSHGIEISYDGMSIEL
ncbi:pyrroloquinoline quinone biosynthesis protein PqqB [Neptuniibacter pectenicola]|jgi:pyrroloquinoline quinone biosynthesis protein B|nr:pyrroloquinoline quinone biosynthesis protein PqqB [Neptuniibacter pectenicola]|eukprot:gnl/Carplike_NY0171/1128_a1533_454.p1 GENE.gnl/Carplike_NY0171/1128_a1533_454~~gnl/Carplike_NY0171/1128_a1533_454.p1  ORF type:complete len:309 (+),score=23.77 gnl/Carplike_NY0171/1128_a1533_454:1240-2166(+)